MPWPSAVAHTRASASSLLLRDSRDGDAAGGAWPSALAPPAHPPRPSFVVTHVLLLAFRVEQFQTGGQVCNGVLYVVRRERFHGRTAARAAHSRAPHHRRRIVSPVRSRSSPDPRLPPPARRRGRRRASPGPAQKIEKSRGPSESPPALPFPSLSACSARRGRRWECLGLPSWPGLPAHPPLLAAAPGGPGHET